VRQEDHRKLLLAAMRAYAGESVIVYAPTIALVEETVDYLAERRIAAIPYHGQMENSLRRRNQERWMNDEVRVLVGTIAFGLGINKPAVRAVIHTSMPKSIEQYYQEAGRAGRDGLPSDCVLLWQPKDAGLLAYFHRSAQRPGREAARLAAVPFHPAVCGKRALPPLANLRALRPDPKWQRCEMCDVCAIATARAPLNAKKRKARRPRTPCGCSRKGAVLKRSPGFASAGFNCYRLGGRTGGTRPSGV
jgi:ATP-dependent DNA helicase RecQ